MTGGWTRRCLKPEPSSDSSNPGLILCAQGRHSQPWERNPGTTDLQEQRCQLFQHLLPAGPRTRWRSRKGWSGRARGKQPLRELQVPVPRLRGAEPPAWVADLYITPSDVQHLFVPAVKPLLAPHQVFPSLSASARAELLEREQLIHHGLCDKWHQVK